MTDDEFGLKEVSIGHNYIFRVGDSEFSFFVLGANPAVGVHVRASRPKMVELFPHGPKVSSTDYWLPFKGHMEVRPGEIVFVLDS